MRLRLQDIDWIGLFLWVFRAVIIVLVLWGTIVTILQNPYSRRQWIDFIIFGVAQGSMYALIAIGYTLVYGVLFMINFAHGEFYMIGGYMSYFLVTRVGGVNPFLGVLFGMVVLLGIGSTFDYLFLRPMHRGEVDRPAEYAILVTFGLSFFLQNLVSFPFSTLTCI